MNDRRQLLKSLFLAVIMLAACTPTVHARIEITDSVIFRSHFAQEGGNLDLCDDNNKEMCKALTDSIECISATPAVSIAAIRTNFLLPLLNVGIEVPIGNRWSVGADWYYPWIWRKWHSKTRMKNSQQLLCGGADVHYWFGKHHTEGASNWKYRLTGHALGFYGYGGYYDFGKNYKGRQGSFTNFGFDYLYSAYLGKSLRIEMSLGFGWIHSWLQKYKVYNEGGHAFRTGGRRTVNWFGPTKATVSLVIPIYKKVGKEAAK